MARPVRPGALVEVVDNALIKAIESTSSKP
jgi:hypothetical protein